MKKTILSTFLMTIALLGSSLSGYNYGNNKPEAKRPIDTATYDFDRFKDETNLKCEYDCTLPEVRLEGSKYYYNTLYLWVGIYSYTIPSENVKFYYILTHNKLNTNSASLHGGYYRIVSKFLKIKIEASVTGTSSSNLILRNYSPEAYRDTNTTEINESHIGFIGDTNDSRPSANIDLGFSNSMTVYSDNVIMTPSSHDKKVTLNYVFKNTHLKSRNGSAPYRGDFAQKCLAIYEVNNYSSSSSSRINFNIHTTAQSQKYTVGAHFCTGYETKTPEQNFSWSTLIRRD